ncbi:tyrosine-type recombinase/integrase [Orientia tsutsugamushi]|uniref:tyrosine-type recombinase/integrase n=1 Tax=Orientia tsutsugamushi TaxID=784 RepID=UPI0035284145
MSSFLNHNCIFFPLFFYFFLYSFHISILCSYFLRSCYSSKSGHLERPYEAWNRICKKAGIKNFKIHDLRRTFASCLSDIGAGQYIIRAALNHINFESTSDYSIVSTELLREYMSKVTQMISGYMQSYKYL